MLPNAIPTFCTYNRWANERLYACCAQVPDAERRLDRGASFRSIHGTLNHLLLADKLWLGRFLNQPFTVTSLGQELHQDFDALRHERTATDDTIDRWATTLTEDALASPITFHSVTFGRQFTLPLDVCVLHFFNHQTHHRGQLTTLLQQAGYEPPNTDLMWLPLRGTLPEL